MDYFRELEKWLSLEKKSDRENFESLTHSQSIQQKRANGMAWYPVIITGQDVGRGDYLILELERPANKDIIHQFRFGAPVAFYSMHEPSEKLEGIIGFVRGDKMRINFRTDEMPSWAKDGKLVVEILFDDYSYQEMEKSLRFFRDAKPTPLTQVLTMAHQPGFTVSAVNPEISRLNPMQKAAVQKILHADELAIVHGPPGTGKTTTIVEAVMALHAERGGKILVTAASNTAVDLLAEKLATRGARVLRIGNPVRVSARLNDLTLDSQIERHADHKEIRKLRRRAIEFKELGSKYKRSFGAAEREQRKALFNEARQLQQEAEKLEQYIMDSVISQTTVIAATLIGVQHYAIRQLQYTAVFIDEAGQALEPACWIPVMHTQKLILAGDHQQLPPTIKSREAAAALERTLLEKMAAAWPQAVVMLEEQYRMNALIMGHSNRSFYQNKLQAHSSVADHVIAPGVSPMVFIDTAGCGFEEQNTGDGIWNPEEALFLKKHFTEFLEKLPESGKITAGIIAPYRRQVSQLEEIFEGFMHPNLDLSINTVDSFQGQERDIIYISLTRSNPDQTIGFLSETRRMNVALTRARKILVVIGDSATISQAPYYADLISFAEEQGIYQSAWEFMG